MVTIAAGAHGHHGSYGPTSRAVLARTTTFTGLDSRTYRGSSVAQTARAMFMDSTFSSSGRMSNKPMSSPLGSTMQTVDFSSDVGRKKFGFSHEDLDDASAYYEGQFKLYQRCGEGTLHNPETGSKYFGQFQNDQFHGEGDQTWPDGSRYVGQWKNGQKHGRGEYTSADELTYVGQWENGLRHGKGTQEYANQDRYEGSFWRGLCSGLGTYHFADGAKYEGAWANGRYDGGGIFFGCDGCRERHVYSNGLLMKRDVLTTSTSKSKSRRDMIGGKVIFGQTRDDMQRPAMLSKLQPSKYLIRRETAGMDLSAPPLRAGTAPAEPRKPAIVEDLGRTSQAPSAPATAPARVQRASLDD